MSSHFSILIQIPDMCPDLWSEILTCFGILEMEIFLIFVRNLDRVSKDCKKRQSEFRQMAAEENVQSCESDEVTRILETYSDFSW